jgi:SAM-dependent methyltransferase
MKDIRVGLGNSPASQMEKRMRLESYGNLCTQFYDISKPEPPPEAFDYYLKLCKSAGGPVLEPMCGSGRFLIPLMERGIDIEGTDASPDMLKACRETAANKGLKPVLYEQFMEETALPKKYLLIFIAAGSFVLVTDKQAARTSLRKIYGHLLPAGEVVLEILTPNAVDRALGEWKGRWVTRQDGATIIFSALDTYDATEKVSRSLHRYELFKSGRLTATELEHFAMRLYEKDEFAALLKEAGFTDIHATRPYGDSEPDEKDNIIVFSAYRRK